MRSFPRRLLCTFVIVGLPVLILAGAWRLGGVSALEDDLLYYFPVRAFIGQALRDGQRPLWNPYVGLGTSVAADPQSGLWYPFTLLFVLLPPFVAYSVTICVHFALAGGGLYRYLRAVRVDSMPALLGALAFEFCGFLVGHRAHLTILQAAAWLGWMLFAWQRLADTGKARYYLLAVIVLGMQMLVQHIQVTVIGGALVTAYVLAVLAPSRPWLLAWFALGAVNGGLIGAVQLAPTFAAYAQSTRSSPAWYLFVENSYCPASLFLWLFPFVFGARTPNLYPQRWWGLSHWCEQATYASVAVLLLAFAGLALWRRSRLVRFWSLAGAVSLVLALGRFTPVSRILFHVPVLNTLRVPARWTLGLELALVVLAAIALDALRRAEDVREPVRRWLRIAWTRLLPASAGVMIAAMLVARYVISRRLDPTLAGHIAEAVRLTNPAIWLPLLMMALTAAILQVVSRRPERRSLAVLLAVVIMDLAGVAAFVDVDLRTYSCPRDLIDPPLARAIHERDPEGRGRLWVPRLLADYDRQADLLWPQTNTLARIPALHNYGPLWPHDMRLLMQFMPWGASQNALSLLCNHRLLGALGVRWLAVRSPEELELIAAAGTIEPTARLTPATQPARRMPLRYRDFRLPVSVASPGIYAVELRVWPEPGDRDRWYLWLEDLDGTPLTQTAWFEPADQAAGPRRIRQHFFCRRAAANAWLRAYAEPRANVSLSDVSFGRVGDLPGRPIDGRPYPRAGALPNGVLLYEVPRWRPRFYWARHVTPAAGKLEAVEKLLFEPEAVGLPDGVVVDARDLPSAWPSDGPRTLRLCRQGLCELELDVSTTDGGLLVWNQSFDAGWQALLDGRPVSIVRANAVISSVWVPPGRHRLSMSYWPTGLTTGIIGSLAALPLLAAGLVLLNWRRGGS